MCLCFFFTYVFLILHFLFCAMIYFVLHMYTVCTAYMCHPVTRRMAYEYVCNELCIRKERDRKLSDKRHKTSSLFCKPSSYVPQRIVISCKPMSPVNMFGNK